MLICFIMLMIMISGKYIMKIRKSNIYMIVAPKKFIYLEPFIQKSKLFPQSHIHIETEPNDEEISNNQFLSSNETVRAPYEQLRNSSVDIVDVEEFKFVFNLTEFELLLEKREKLKSCSENKLSIDNYLANATITENEISKVYRIEVSEEDYHSLSYFNNQESEKVKGGEDTLESRLRDITGNDKASVNIQSYNGEAKLESISIVVFGFLSILSSIILEQMANILINFTKRKFGESSFIPPPSSRLRGYIGVLFMSVLVVITNWETSIIQVLRLAIIEIQLFIKYLISNLMRYKRRYY